jgi:hypothetical protein
MLKVKCFGAALSSRLFDDADLNLKNVRIAQDTLTRSDSFDVACSAVRRNAALQYCLTIHPSAVTR